MHRFARMMPSSRRDAPEEAEAGLQQNNPPQSPTPKTNRTARLLEYGEAFIQAAVGVLLLLGAVVAVGYTVYHFIAQIRAPFIIIGPSGQVIHLTTPQNLAEAIINLLSDLLLVLIIGEIFSMVLRYFQDKMILLKPFLFIGIISAARDILAVSARIAVIEVSEPEFTQSMIELAVNLGIILGLSVALRLLRKEDVTNPL